MNKITKVILISLIIGLLIGTGYAISSDSIRLGKNNVFVETVTGIDGKPVTFIKPPTYGTSEFEAYKAERGADLKNSAQKSPKTIVWATINFNDISPSELERLKTKYSLMLMDISGAASETFQSEVRKDATAVAVDVEELGEKPEWFSKVYYVTARASVIDLDKLSVEPNVILVDLNINGEIHRPVYIPR